MELTRVDTAKLRKALEAANHRLEEALAEVATLLVQLNEAERSGCVRPPVRFVDAGRDMVRVAELAPGLAQTADFHPAAVTEDLDNVALLAPLSQNVDRLKSLLDDSRLAWLAEAYQPSLVLYRLAKEGLRTNPRLEPIVLPLADVFASRRRPARGAPEETG
jgi:hypothetical protein